MACHCCRQWMMLGSSQRKPVDFKVCRYNASLSCTPPLSPAEGLLEVLHEHSSMHSFVKYLSFLWIRYVQS